MPSEQNPSKTWLGKPQEVNKKIFEWKTNWANIVRVDEEIQFSGDKVYAITVTDREYEYKKNLLCRKHGLNI